MKRLFRTRYKIVQEGEFYLFYCVYERKWYGLWQYVCGSSSLEKAKYKLEDHKNIEAKWKPHKTETKLIVYED